MPVHRLPPELLALVFFIYAVDNHAFDDLRWTKLLVVCKRWHAVGMQTPKLWSFINLRPATSFDVATRTVVYSEERDIRDIERIEAQRARAGNAPLHIEMDLTSYLSAAKLACIPTLWQPRSLRYMEISGLLNHIYKVLDLLASHEHPALTHLGVSVWNIRLIGDDSDACALLLDDILKHNVPNLQFLSTAKTQFDWTLVRNLRTLTFDHRNGSRVTFKFTAQDILDALTQCPSLEEFKLLLPSTYRSTVSTLTTAALPQMAELAIEGNAELCNGLLHAVTNIPSTAKLCVFSCDPSEVTRGSHIFSMASYMGTHASRMGVPTLRTLAVGSKLNQNPGGPQMWKLMFTGQRHLTRDWSWTSDHAASESASHSLSITTRIASISLLEDTITNILQSWPLADATHLDARRFGTLKPIHWRALLTKLPSITTIILRPENHSGGTLLEVLRADLQEHGRRTAANIVFDTCNVMTGSIYDENNDLSYHGGGAVARLMIMRVMSYCADAARAGVPLDTVEFIGDVEGSKYGILDELEAEGERDWSELYKDLREGFVYEGYLHNATSGQAGVERSSFEGW
ncbi:hypothetical protein PENSPDRAFT_647089 [Peniophora sp. CONT]|nr:hypothetical protein PENSPDRAFT_647089 [Peniophora sp. CONT]